MMGFLVSGRLRRRHQTGIVQKNCTYVHSSGSQASDRRTDNTPKTTVIKWTTIIESYVHPNIVMDGYGVQSPSNETVAQTVCTFP